MIGKISVVAVALFVILGIAMVRVAGEPAVIGLAIVAVVVFLIFLASMLWVGARFPNLAATEGPTYVQSRQIDLALKGGDAPPTITIGPDPQNPTLLGDE